MLSLTVEDAGPGIPDESKERVFEAFTQLAPSHQGSGIGLSLVAELARLHGGRAWVEDRPGGGARFRVELPTSPPDTASQDRARRVRHTQPDQSARVR